MQEGTPVTSLVFPEFRGVYKKAIAGGEEKPRSWRPRRKPKARQIIHDDRRIGILGSQVVSELVAQVGGRVPLGEHRGWGVTMDGTMIGRQQHRHAASLGF